LTDVTHRYETVAQFLILSTLSLVLGAPISAREIHEVDVNVNVVAEDVVAVWKKRYEVGESIG
jgi:hypothetical protein